MGHRTCAFGVRLSRRIEIDVVAQEVAECDGVGMVVVRAGLLLMSQARIESRALVHIGVAIPVAASTRPAHLGAAVPGEAIATIEHRNAVNEATDSAKASERLLRRHRSRHARQTVD